MWVFISHLVFADLYPRILRATHAANMCWGSAKAGILKTIKVVRFEPPDQCSSAAE